MRPRPAGTPFVPLRGMHTQEAHHCPALASPSWDAPRPPRGPRQAEPADRCAPPPCRRHEPDRYTPCTAGYPDEHIPGRLTYDLYLVRSNRQARAAEVDGTHRDSHRLHCERPGDRDNDRDGKCGADRHRAIDAYRAADRAGSACAPDRTHAASFAAHAPVRLAHILVMATRRGSIIDVLA
jgi:hypothetical protein